MDQGQLVPTTSSTRWSPTACTSRTSTRGYILDGFPRTLAQAEWLDAHLGAECRQRCSPVVAISIVVDVRPAAAVALPAAASRRVQAHLQHLLRIRRRLTASATSTASRSSQRADDTEAVFDERMKTFEAQTAPVIEHYRAAGSLRRGRRRSAASSTCQRRSMPRCTQRFVLQSSRNAVAAD